jgi:hypothetical protein
MNATEPTDGIGEIEAEYPNQYRQCSQALFPILYDLLARMPDNEDKWGISFALMSPEIDGRSMADIAVQIKSDKATLSAIARRFCNRHGLSYSPAMRAGNSKR